MAEGLSARLPDLGRFSAIYWALSADVNILTECKDKKKAYAFAYLACPF